MISFFLSGYDNEKEHTIAISFQKSVTTFQIDSEYIDYNTTELITDLHSYEFKRRPDVSFLDRSFFLHFKKYFENKCIINMLRAFACSYAFIQLGTQDFCSSYMLDNTIDSAKERFSNLLIIDWTEREEPQPQMYFIREMLFQENESDLEGLYKDQLLQKYSIKYGSKLIETMYVPFDLPNKNNYQIISKYSTWRKIVNGINAEVKRIVSNWSGK